MAVSCSSDGMQGKAQHSHGAKGCDKPQLNPEYDSKDELSWSILL